MTSPLEADAGMRSASAERTTAVRLPAFILATLAWLVPAFAVWYFAAPIVVAPVVWLARIVALVGLHDTVQAIASCPPGHVEVVANYTAFLQLNRRIS